MWPDASVNDRSFVSEQDWANAKRLWSNHQPMDSEALMVQQASQLRRLNPQSKPWVCESHLSAVVHLKSPDGSEILSLPVRHLLDDGSVDQPVQQQLGSSDGWFACWQIET